MAEEALYYRPETMAELDDILSKFDGKVNFLPGGNYNFANLDEYAPLVDLQSLGLDQIISSGSTVELPVWPFCNKLVRLSKVGMPCKRRFRLRRG